MMAAGEAQVCVAGAGWTCPASMEGIGAMRFGVCTWVFGGAPMATVAQKLAGMGYDGLELFGDRAHSPSTLKPLMDGLGLRVLSITPENVDLAHPDPGVRREALDYYRWAIDLAAGLGCPIVSCHGAVGRVRPLATQEAELAYLREGVAALAEAARAAGVRIAVEVLNRYESHLVNTARQALDLLEGIDPATAGILLDAYHMNIEEARPDEAVRLAGKRLFLFHVADSNRAAPGRGHTDWAALFAALRAAGYSGDVIVECTASGPDPFTPVKAEGWREELEGYLRESLAFLERGLGPRRR